MSLSAYILEYGRHVEQLCRRRRRCAYAPTSKTSSHDNHEKMNSWVPFLSYMSMGLRLAAAGAPLIINTKKIAVIVYLKSVATCMKKHTGVNV